jgi:cytochrome c oxidase subunit 2
MINILIAIVVFLIVVTLVQILRVSELLSEINNTDVNEITDEDNDTQGKLYLGMLFLFLGFVVWQMISWDHLLLPGASSVHGEIIDGLMSFTMSVILVVFFILTPLLFFYAFKYRGKKTNTAYFYAHNNKLEIIWTVIPAIFLSGVIVYGLQTWNKAMNPDISNSKVIEVYSKQFDWTARYSGDDNQLGNANYKLVQGRNKLGVDLTDENAEDDIVVREVHLIKDEPVLLKFRSQDVIHSAFLPYFRVQMNCVPGMITQFAFTPTKTTAEMRETEGEDFDYILLCNKICGVAHYNMQMKFVVETKEEYEIWLAQQKTLKNTLTLK